jgi:hypothetical protein
MIRVMEAAQARSSVMPMKARLVLAAGVCLAAGSVTAALGEAAQHGMGPRPALVSAHGLTVRSTVGSYCVDGRPHHGTSVSGCTDSAYPIGTRGKLPVSGGDRLALRFRHNPRIEDTVTRARVSLLRVHDDITYISHPVAASQNRRHPSRWHVRLPGDLKDANKLDISVKYRNGDADFWAGIAPRD